MEFLLLQLFPRTIQAVGEYRRALEPARDFWKYDDTLQCIKDHLFLQQRQLETTLQQLGLAEPTKLELESQLLKLYPHQAAEFLSIIGRIERVMATLAYKLDIDSQGRVSKLSLKGFE